MIKKEIEKIKTTAKRIKTLDRIWGGDTQKSTDWESWTKANSNFRLYLRETNLEPSTAVLKNL